MQNQINTTPITQLIQQIRSAEVSRASSVSIDIQKARMISLALVELLDRINQDYESMYNQLKNAVNTEIVNVSMDGGGFENNP
jgi:hypothetical protein